MRAGLTRISPGGSVSVQVQEAEVISGLRWLIPDHQGTNQLPMSTSATWCGRAVMRSVANRFDGLGFTDSGVLRW
ncbi:hypothetical protein F4560_000829 [Saccharothrix ecbatanensis]|uniref:Uncharacterized protein n=1 Tax=Saccharothrix ecbatanensis TaxID=1105145 RepID=A0A7W9HFK1_9PSEU|nr:hypothetical protein [Saccharothrix ecbatanensis]